MISAKGVLRTEGFRYALDNGAWWAHQNNQPFDVAAFETAIAKLGKDADFVVLPDVVAGGLPSLKLSLSWLPKVATQLLLIPVQNGMVARDLQPHVSKEVGIFVGGTADWKEQTIPIWGKFAREIGCYCHVGRVNTVRRIAICRNAGVHSFDGSSVSRYAKTLPPLDAARRQVSLLEKL